VNPTGRLVEILLKIPDNTAYTALVALRRLGVDVSRVERGVLRFFDEEEPVEELIVRIQSDETIFNPNVHRLRLRDGAAPDSGEVWIESLDETVPAVAWRLFDSRERPLSEPALRAAAERLLCNPSIDKAIVGSTGT